MRKHKPIVFDSLEKPTTYNFSDLTGKRFGKLVVVSFAGKRRSRSHWNCQCDCGGESILDGAMLNSGHVRSCGCIQGAVTVARNKAMATHGETVGGKPTPEFKTWDSMIDRCCNASHPSYKNYGGAGVKICERWRHSFENFLADMGRRPSPKHSIDRYPDPWGDYEPANCRWATATEQQHNRRCNTPLPIQRRLL